MYLTAPPTTDPLHPSAVSLTNPSPAVSAAAMVSPPPTVSASPMAAAGGGGTPFEATIDGDNHPRGRSFGAAAAAAVAVVAGGGGSDMD